MHKSNRSTNAGQKKRTARNVGALDLLSRRLRSDFRAKDGEDVVEPRNMWQRYRQGFDSRSMTEERQQTSKILPKNFRIKFHRPLGAGVFGSANRPRFSCTPEDTQSPPSISLLREFVAFHNDVSCDHCHIGTFVSGRRQSDHIYIHGFDSTFSIGLLECD